MTEREQLAYSFIQYAKRNGLTKLEADRQLKQKLDEYDRQSQQQMPERDQIAVGFIKEAKKMGVKKDEVQAKLQEVLDDYDRTNLNEKDKLAYDFIREAQQQGLSRQEIGTQLHEKLNKYDLDQKMARYQDNNNDDRNISQKTIDFMEKWGGSVSVLGKALGESFAADEATKMQQESQQRRIAQDELIMQKVKEARQAGNEKEAQRLLGILNDPQYQDTTDYDQQVQDYKLGQQRAVQGGVGTAGSLALSNVSLPAGATAFERIGNKAIMGAAQGALQGGSLSEADLVNKGEYDKLSGDIGTGTALGAATGAVLGVGEEIARNVFPKVSSKVSEKVQKVKDKVNDIKEKVGKKTTDDIYQAQSFDDYAKNVRTAQAQDMVSETIDTPQVKETIKEVVQEKVDDARPLVYNNLEKGKKTALRRATEAFANKNNISVSRQKGYALQPYDTLGEINEQLKDVGVDLSNMDMDDLALISDKITGDQGATTKITREIISKTNNPIARTTTIDGERVDPVIDAMKRQIQNSPHLRSDTKFKKATEEIIQKTLDDAIDGNDLNRYAPDKLYDSLRTLQGFKADAQITANRSIMPNASDVEAAKVYDAAAKEVENMLNKATLENEVFTQGRDMLANYYRDELGMSRLADQVANAKNLAQLRSTAKVWTRFNIMHQDALAQALSTMNRNTKVGNDLISGVARLIPGGSKIRGAAQIANALTGGSVSNAAGNLIEDLVSR